MRDITNVTFTSFKDLSEPYDREFDKIAKRFEGEFDKLLTTQIKEDIMDSFSEEFSKHADITLEEASFPVWLFLSEVAQPDDEPQDKVSIEKLEDYDDCFFRGLPSVGCDVSDLMTVGEAFEIIQGLYHM